MKKLFVLLLTAFVFIGATACQSSDNTSAESSVSSTPSSGVELPEDKFD